MKNEIIDEALRLYRYNLKASGLLMKIALKLNSYEERFLILDTYIVSMGEKCRRP